ncbi:hypothetical protein [Tautonia plasticadhaerens]|uniref:PEP-CTERM protein-sorting domain-containing protein n=1 Tax=Tautonia plasticadhaerens TaxID=2527974 RepID=A0A518H1W1_9BACT|nr:hypothetical protein [Tautonia plasticadhaerens]QDV34815.1 hypothetical protein ElP_27120 [Tautonia plasticadhaerens]
MRPSTLALRSGYGPLCAALVWLGLATEVRAEWLINVDFNAQDSPTYSGAGVLGASGDVWNGIVGTSHTGDMLLVDSANADTGVTLSYRDFDPASDAAGSAIFAGTPYDALLRDYLIAPGNDLGFAGIVTFSGLTPGGTYRLILYSVANLPDRGATFTANGDSQVVVPSGIPVLAQGDNYADFTTRADATGMITITASSGDGSEADLNGFQLQQLATAVIPEPASLVNVLLGIALLGGGVACRRLRGNAQASAEPSNLAPQRTRPAAAAPSHA